MKTMTYTTQNMNDPDLSYRDIKSTQKYESVPSKFASSDDDSTVYTRIVCMSDTHGNHRSIHVPKCDVLIHGGDFSKTGENSIVKDLADYFEELKQNGTVGKVICIAGNHDLTFQPDTYRENWSRFHPKSGANNCSEIQALKDNFKTKCIYLEDESFTDENDIEYYGSPYTPTYGHCWAFMKNRDEIGRVWDKIPETTDVLITHGPPLGRGDKCKFGNRAGCLNLLEQIQTRIKPRLHVFGHIHEDSGYTFDGTTLFVNASNVTIKYSPEQPCTVIDLPTIDKHAIPRVVIPQCHLTSLEILDWLERHEYKQIYPYFANRQPLLNGSDLVQEDLNIENLACKLKMHSARLYKSDPSYIFNWKVLKKELTNAMIHLRSCSYGSIS